MHIDLPNQPKNEFSFNEKAMLGNMNYGASGDFGFRIPIQNRELIIKTGYKLVLKDLSVTNNVYNRCFRLRIGVKL